VRQCAPIDAFVLVIERDAHQRAASPHAARRVGGALLAVVYNLKMSSLIRGCCAIILLSLCACGPRVGAVPNHPSAEARNGETGKKTRKQRPPLVAPPPAYGNKIVQSRGVEPAAVAQSESLTTRL
jgi:hypothetical protein